MRLHVDEEDLALVRSWIFGDAEARESAAERIDQMREQDEGLAVWLMMTAILRGLLIRRVRAEPALGHIRFVADLRGRYADSWAKGLRPKPMEEVVSALLTTETERFEAVADDEKVEIIIALLMMTAENANLEPYEVDELIEQAREFADQALSSPEAETLLAQFR